MPTAALRASMARSADGSLRDRQQVRREERHQASRSRAPVPPRWQPGEDARCARQRRLGVVPRSTRTPSSTSAQPEPRTTDLDQGEVVASRLLVSSRDSSKALELVKEALNHIALPIQLSIEAMLLLPLRLRMNHRLLSPVPHRLHEFVRVVPGVTDQRLPVRMIEQVRRGDQLVPLPRRQGNVERPPFRVDDDVQLGRKTSSRAAQGIGFDPPFPPDASWCARTTEPSTMEPVLSTSNCSSRKMAAQCPLRAQFANRL